MLKEILDQYVEILFPYAADDEDHRVIFKVDGGPGRLNVAMLAELRCKGVYLFPEVQNTTHATQETNHNYGAFKSALHIDVQRATSHLAAKYHEQLLLHETNPMLHPFPKKLPSLSRADYPRLVAGSDSEPTLLPAFQNAFNKERIL